MAYIGEIRMFCGNFAPVGWVFCNGQALPISEYDTLYNLSGTTYGGDGSTFFNVPDLQSRIPVGTGSNALGTFNIGDKGGVEEIILTTQNLPAHNHAVSGTAGILVSSEDGHKTTPANNYPAVNGQNMYSTTTDGSQMPAVTPSLTVGATGGSQPFSNVQPYLAINYIISFEGIFPTT
jgi:microcystin-dependent protein